MYRTGIDSFALAKEYVPLESYVGEKLAQAPQEIQKPIVAKALVGASVTTQDPDFDKKYQGAIRDVFQRLGLIYLKKQLLNK
jgi:hypothetical protein